MNDSDFLSWLDEKTSWKPKEWSDKERLSHGRILKWIDEGRVIAHNIADPGKKPEYRITPQAIRDFYKSCETSPAVPKDRPRPNSTKKPKKFIK